MPAMGTGDLRMSSTAYFDVIDNEIELAKRGGLKPKHVVGTLSAGSGRGLVSGDVRRSTDVLPARRWQWSVRLDPVRNSDDP